jgi:hypothetical protein
MSLAHCTMRKSWASPYADFVRIAGSDSKRGLSDAIPEMTRMLMDGKMSLGVRKIERTPAIKIKTANTINV